MYQED